jgi:AMP deaminase
MAEYRISIYGRKQEEWDQLARWIVENELYSENVTWLIQVRFGVLSEIKLVLCITQPFLLRLFFHSRLVLFVSSQLPRLYNVYKEMNIIQSFETVLENVFAPLFEVTVDPSSHPKLHVLLSMVSRIPKL